MPFDSDSFLTAARVLLAAAPDDAREAAYRSAISRAYYASFLRARALIETDGVASQTLRRDAEHSHSEV